MELRIDPEFQNKIPPLTDEEYSQLEENIVTAGEVYEPIVTWGGIIVDGHNRWKIIQDHPEVSWRTRSMDFADKWAAFDWMYKNQLGRRNLTEQQRAVIIGEMYKARKKAEGAPIGNTHASKQLGENRQVERTQKEIKAGTSAIIAKELGIGERTVRDNEKYADGISAIREEEPELADSILKGQMTVKKADVMEIAKEAGKPTLREKIERLKAGESIRTPQKPKEPEPIAERKEEQPARIIQSEPIPVYQSIADNPRAWKSGTRENREFNRQIREQIANMSDPSKVPPYTLEMLFKEAELAFSMYIGAIESVYLDHKELFTKANKDRIKKFYEEHLDNEIKRIKGEIQYV